jgi:DNA polymerase-3 subunit gamma/tau
MAPEGMLASLARHALLVERAGDKWTLKLDPGHQVLASDERVAALSQAVSDYVGRRVKLNVVTATGVDGTPAQRAEKARAEQVAHAREQLSADAVVRQMVETFSGKLDEDSIQPRDN